MITDIDYLKAVNSIGLFLKKRHKLSLPQIQGEKELKMRTKKEPIRD